MIEAAFLSTSATSLTPEEAERLGVYVLSGIVGLVVAGLIGCAKALRNDLVHRD